MYKKSNAMHALRVTRVHLSVMLAICFALCRAGVYAFWIGQGKNGFDSLPLVWYLVLVLGPLLSLGCFISMWRVRAGSGWWLGVGALLLIPQLFVWFVAVDGVLHYLGIVRHGLFG
jgi:hypothetical protein